MRIGGYYVDVEETLDILLCLSLAVLIVQWATTSSTPDSTGYTAESQGDAPVMLTSHALEHLEDGGTIDVDRWHGGTLHLEGYQTIDVEEGDR